MGSNSRLSPKFKRRCVNLEKSFKNVKIMVFFYIFLDISHKMKINLGQEHVKKRDSILVGQNWKNFSDYPGKMTVFSCFEPTIPPVPH